MSAVLEQAKRAARDELRAALAAMRPQLVAVSEAICGQIAGERWWLEANTVMAFGPMPGEVDLTELVSAGLAEGKRICVPRVDWGRRTMSPVALGRWPGDLISGRHGVPEPRADLPAIDVSDLDLIIAPGLGFDAAGNRLGRGAGFYDRFLTSPGLRAVVAGVCPEAAIRDAIPAGAMDVPVRFLVTERRVISCGVP